MNLTKSQKKFIKKNLRKYPLGEIAQKVGLTEPELIGYLGSVLAKEKLKKIISSQETKPPRLKPNVLILGFLTVLVLVVYANSLGNEFLSDDIAGIVQDKHMGDFVYYLQNNTINFFRYFFYSIAFRLFGLNQVFFRLINVFFHLGCVLVIFSLLSRFKSRSLALITAGVFAVHPLLSESVTWISGGLYAQYGFFVLLSFWLYLLSENQNRLFKHYFLSILLFIPALFTTEKAVVLAPLLLAYELCLGNLGRNWKRLAPYFLLAGGVAFLVFFGGPLGQRVNALKTNYYQEGGLYNPLTQIPTAISSYLQLIFWPDKLTLYHSEMVFTNSRYALMFTITLTYFMLILYTFFKKKYRWYCFWLSFLFISLIPMLTPFKVAWIVAERYAYLGSVGILVIIGAAIEKVGQAFRNRQLSYIILGILLIVLSARTIIRNRDWKNQDNLWLAAARTSPSSPQNHNNLGDLYSRRGDFPKAEEEFKKAIALLPNYGDAYHNLANTYLQTGKLELAVAHYQKALEFNPNLWQSHQNLAAIFAQNNQWDLTEEHLKKAILISPKNHLLHLNLGYVYFTRGKKKKAKEEWETVLKIDPTNQDALKFLSSLGEN